MVRITFIDYLGTERQIDTVPGGSVMQAAVANSVPGIEAHCGGNQACATCQVYVDEPWLTQVGPAGEQERQMLEFATSAKANSRLACQIVVTEALDGLIVRTPEQQN